MSLDDYKMMIKWVTKFFIIAFAGLGGILSFFIDWTNQEEIKNFFEIFFFDFFFTWGLVCIPFIIGFIARKIAKKDVEIEQLSKFDLEKTEEYFREILKINPLKIAFIDKFTIDIDAVVAELLYLKLKNVVEINEDGIYIKSEDMNNLSLEQKYILNNINDRKLRILNREEFCEKLREVIGEKTYYNSNYFVKKSFSTPKVYTSFILGTAMCCLLPIAGYVKMIEFGIIGMILGSLIIAYGFSYASQESQGMYKRTKAGEELNRKIEGLKIFLKDYSLLEKRDFKEIELWEEYLIYSVLFGHNKKILKEYEKYIDIQDENITI